MKKIPNVLSFIDNEKQEMVKDNKKDSSDKEEAILEDQLSKIAGNDAFNAFVEVFDKVPTEGKYWYSKKMLDFYCNHFDNYTEI